MGTHWVAEGFDRANLNVDGDKAPADTRKVATALDNHKQIKDLAKGVKVWPTGADALDFTRAVRYAEQYPEEGWKYPDDMERLTRDVLNGPDRVTPDDQDSTAIERFQPLMDLMKSSSTSNPSRPKKAA